MINDACLTELTPEWIDENGVGRCTVGKFVKLLSEVFDRTPEAKRSKFSPFASYTLQDDVAHSISKKFQLYKD